MNLMGQITTQIEMNLVASFKKTFDFIWSTNFTFSIDFYDSHASVCCHNISKRIEKVSAIN